MTILNSELIMLLSDEVSDDTTNGGRMDNMAGVTTGVPNNVWPNVFRAERISGSTKYRKTFFKVANDDDDTLFNPQVWIDVITPGDDYVCFYVGSQIDTQGTAGAGITGTDAYGCGSLRTNVIATDTTMVVDVEAIALATGGADEIFRDGMTIRITNKDTPSSITGTEEIVTINAAPSTANDTEVTLSFTPALSNNYNTDDNTYGTRIMSVYEPSDVSGSVDNYVLTGTGTFDDASYPVLIDNLGSIEQEITMDFSSATVFTAVSDVAGVTLTGDVLELDGLWRPENTDVSKYYLVLEHNGFTVAPDATTQLVFETHPVSIPIWQKRVVPAGANSLSGNRTVYALAGEAN